MKGGGLKNQVRIIGGQWKRRMLSFPDSEGLRPTPDRVRETLFNWLGQDCSGWHCLDLFAGSGALGFEAASRGAARVVMVERERAVAQVLAGNIQTLKAGGVIHLVQQDALGYLAQTRDTFDVVFLDPPFASDLLERVLPLLLPRLSSDALVYAETAAWPDLTGWEVLREGKAGTVHYGLLTVAGRA